MKTIDIRTTQNVTIEYELASLQDRGVAFFIDLIIIACIYIFTITLLIYILGEVILDSNIAMYALFGLFPIGLLMGYMLSSEVIANGQSWGKKLMKIKVVRLDGREPGLSDYLLRAVFHIVDFILSMGILGALLIGSSLKNQRLGDMTANTTVIRLRQQLNFHLADILKIQSIENYVPKYPEVRQLSEQDMLLIKNIINRHQTYKNEAHHQAVHLVVERIKEQLGILDVPKDRIEFLKTLIRDYIVLTR